MKAKLMIILGGLVVAGMAVLNWITPKAPAPTMEPVTARSREPDQAEAPLGARRSGPPLPPENPAPTNLLTRLMSEKFEVPKLTLEQVEPFLAANHRNAESLVVASRLTGDQKFLQEAKEKFPHDPTVAFDGWFRSSTPEEKRQWLDTFKQSAPDNAMASYLSAADHFKAGDKNQALQEIASMGGRSKFQDYSAEFVQSSEEAFRTAGYSEAEAKAASGMGLLLPQLAPLKQLGRDLSGLATAYQQAGDPASAQAAVRMGMDLGQQLSDGPGQARMIDDLVGIAIQKLVLGALDPAAPYGNSGQTVQDQLNQLTQHRADIKALADPGTELFKTLPDQDLAAFFDRERVFGETAAMRWMVNKYGPPAAQKTGP